VGIVEGERVGDLDGKIVGLRVGLLPLITVSNIPMRKRSKTQHLNFLIGIKI
jgi:hypothetical protein